MNFHNVWQSIQNTGGASYNLSTAEMNPTTGYMVALKGVEQIYPVPSTMDEFKNILQDYLKGTKLHTILSNRELFVGFWIDEGKLYVDLSEIVITQRDAIEKAKENEQRAIYDCAGKEVLYIVSASTDKDILTDKKY